MAESIASAYYRHRNTKSASAPLEVDAAKIMRRSSWLAFESLFEYSGSMGTNRRYAHRIDENMARRATEAAARPRPLGLTPSELDLKNNPIIEVQEPIPVQAWVTWQTQPVLTQARAVKWTARAVCIEWTDGTGATYQSWVWASAVDRL